MDAREYKTNSLTHKFKTLLGVGQTKEVTKKDTYTLLTRAVTCIELGMIPNDESEGVNNVKRLIEGIKSGVTVIVDNRFYLRTEAPSSVDTDVSIIGLNASAEFVLSGSHYILFDPGVNCKNISIQKLKLTSTINDIVLFEHSGKKYYELVDISDNTLSGSISVFREISPTNINPDAETYGIHNFIFDKNIVTNTRLSCIKLHDTPVDTMYVRGNHITNFDYKFVDVSTDNDGSFESQVSKSRKLLVVCDNYVKCNDNWWGDKTNNGYYCFVLYEGSKAIYYHNHIEGIKSINRDCALYDAYLSADEVYYYNNTWKNNIVFNSPKQYNVLMKAKSGGSIKRYCNNMYVVEERFAEVAKNMEPSLANLTIDAVKDMLQVQLFQAQARTTRWEIRNNTFDVYYIVGQSGSMYADEVWMLHNDFKCTKFSYTMFYYRIDYDSQNPAEIDYSKVVHKIIGNNIKISGNETNPTFKFVSCTNNSNGADIVYPSVEICDNNLDIDSCSYLTSNLYAYNLTVRNNTIVVTSKKPYQGGTMLYLETIQNMLTNCSNKIVKPYGRQYAVRIKLGRCILNEDFSITDVGGEDTGDRVFFEINLITDYKYIYRRRFKIQCNEGSLDFYMDLEFLYNPVDGFNYIGFTDTSDKKAYYKLQKVSGNGEGHGKNVKLVGNFGTKQYRFYNNGSYPNIMYFSSWGNEAKYLEIKSFTRIAGLFNITKGNDVLKFASESGRQVSIDMPDGVYSGYQLASALQKAMNANTTLSGNGSINFKVTWDIVSQYFTINAGTGHKVSYIHSGSDAGATLGFNANIAAAEIVRSQVACG